MGTDIHGVFQRHDQCTNTWVDIPHKYGMDRHYQLFAVLAGVRNGTGFAGVKTGDWVKPIAEPRGYPEGFQVGSEDDEGDDCHSIQSLDHMDPRSLKYHEEGEALAVWMGDHTHSWLHADEMLEWFASAPSVVKVGILDRDVYEAWDKKSEPPSYCGGISGQGIAIVNDNAIEKEANPNWTHIRCEWDQGLKEELAYFFEEVSRLKTDYGNVRFVFGFDS